MIEFITLIVMLVILWKLWDAGNVPEPDGDDRVVFNLAHYNGIVVEGDINLMILREGKRVTLNGTPTTKVGNPAAYEQGTAVWELSDTDNFKLEVNPENELEATVTCVNGSTNPAAIVSCSLDGDPDADEVRTLVGTLDLVGSQGEATQFSLSASAPSDVPDETAGGEDEEAGNEGSGGPTDSEGGSGSVEEGSETTDETSGGGNEGSPSPEEDTFG